MVRLSFPRGAVVRQNAAGGTEDYAPGKLGANKIDMADVDFRIRRANCEIIKVFDGADVVAYGWGMSPTTTTATTTPLGNTKKRAKFRPWVVGKPSKASAILAQWMRRNRWNRSMLAKHLGCTWVRATWIMTGQVEPSVIQALALRELVGAPIVAWREAA